MDKGKGITAETEAIAFHIFFHHLISHSFISWMLDDEMDVDTSDEQGISS